MVTPTQAVGKMERREVIVWDDKCHSLCEEGEGNCLENSGMTEDDITKSAMYV